jgi:hypothetical protein
MGTTTARGKEITSPVGIPAIPIIEVGFDPVDVAPITERMAYPPGPPRATACVVPLVCLMDAKPPSRDELVRFLSALGESHAKLDLDLGYLDELASAVFDRDPTQRAAADAIMLRAREIAELKSALGQVALAVSEPSLEPLLAPGTTLGAYLRALYLWAHRIVDTLRDFAASALCGAPDWHAFDARTADVSEFQVHALTEQIRHEARAVRTTPIFRDALEEHFWAAWYLHRSINKAGDPGAF